MDEVVIAAEPEVTAEDTAEETAVEVAVVETCSTELAVAEETALKRDEVSMVVPM